MTGEVYSLVRRSLACLNLYKREWKWIVRIAAQTAN